MKVLNLKICEHEEYGMNGIYWRSGRDYFEPATSGLQVAHDLLEHPVNPHPNGYVDELLALGAIVAGRIEHGYTYDRRGYLTIGDIAADVGSLIYNALSVGDHFWEIECNSRLQDKNLMEDIRQCVIKGIKDGVDQYADPYEDPMDVVTPTLDNLVAWICKGHQLFRKRYNDTYAVSINMFDRISAQADAFLKGGELGDEMNLHYDVTKEIVFLDYCY